MGEVGSTMRGTAAFRIGTSAHLIAEESALASVLSVSLRLERLFFQFKLINSMQVWQVKTRPAAHPYTYPAGIVSRPVRCPYDLEQSS